MIAQCLSHKNVQNSDTRYVVGTGVLHNFVGLRTSNQLKYTVYPFLKLDHRAFSIQKLAFRDSGARRDRVF